LTRSCGTGTTSIHFFCLNYIFQIFQAANADPFVKVRGLIEDMIAKLMQQAAEEADGKAFCDEQISSTKKKQEKVNFS